MTKTLLTILVIFIGYNTSAQITTITDAAFEEALIDLNIDSDGIVNGEVLTSDIQNITQLVLDASNSTAVSNIQDFTGIRYFTSLESLTINYSQLSVLDVSHNTLLKILNCRSNMLTGIDVSSNLLLEELYLGNGGDVGPFNEITEIDLSNNSNIKLIEVQDMWTLDKINLKNGNNNPDINIQLGFYIWGPIEPGQINNTVCIEVDNEQLAQSNQLPYSAWQISHFLTAINFTENCILSTPEFIQNKSVFVYPNPATDVLHIENKLGGTIDNIILYDISGRMVREYYAVSAKNISVSGLEKGMYLLKVIAGKEATTQKIIIK